MVILFLQKYDKSVRLPKDKHFLFGFVFAYL